MDDVQEAKRRFVDRKLAPMLVAATAGDVAGCDYAAADGEEFVHVEHANGFRRRVCVTGDSLPALVGDVLAAIR